MLRVDQYDATGIRDDLLHWLDEGQLDPYLSISVLEPHPAFSGLRPSWIYGTCWNVSGKEEAASFELAPPDIQADYRNAVPLAYENQLPFPGLS